MDDELSFDGLSGCGETDCDGGGNLLYPTNIMTGAIHKAANLFQENPDGHGHVCRLASQDILSVTARSKLLNKRIVMQVRNLESREQEVVIDNGALSIKSIVEAISKLTKVDGTV